MSTTTDELSNNSDAPTNNPQDTNTTNDELNPQVADVLNLDQSLFDECLIRNIKLRHSTAYYVSFDTYTGKPDSYSDIKDKLKQHVTEQKYEEFYDNVITNDQCVIEYDFPLVSVKRVLHVKQGGFSIRELCGLVARDFADIYKEQLWVPGVTLKPGDLAVNTFFVFHEPITVPADPELCVTRVSLGIEPRVITKLKELTEQSKSKGSIKQMMKKITEIAQENALNAVQAPIIEVEPILDPPISLATLAETLPDEDEEPDELMNKIVNEILPSVRSSSNSQGQNANSANSGSKVSNTPSTKKPETNKVSNSQGTNNCDNSDAAVSANGLGELKDSPQDIPQSAAIESKKPRGKTPTKKAPKKSTKKTTKKATKKATKKTTRKSSKTTTKRAPRKTVSDKKTAPTPTTNE